MTSDGILQLAAIATIRKLYLLKLLQRDYDFTGTLHYTSKLEKRGQGLDPYRFLIDWWYHLAVFGYV